MNRKTPLFLTMAIFLFSIPVAIAQQGDVGLEHGIIKVMPGFSLNQKASKIDPYGFLKVRPKGEKSFVVEGVYRYLRYEKLDASGKRTRGLDTGAILGNYKAAAIEKGGRVLNSGSSQLFFSLPRTDGGTTFALVVSSTSYYYIEVVDEASLEKVITFGAEEMKIALDKEGRIAIYGINFDTDKADLKLGAEEILSEIVKLMQLYPALKIEIQGHTDDIGSADHNMQLSKLRAGAVKNFILLYGISTSRLVAQGYGMTTPLVPNDSDENRAKNRRVELIRVE